MWPSIFKEAQRNIQHNNYINETSKVLPFHIQKKEKKKRKHKKDKKIPEQGID